MSQRPGQTPTRAPAAPAAGAAARPVAPAARTAVPAARVAAPAVTRPAAAPATTDVTDEERDPWELETGLPNDVDAYMANCMFGMRDRYMQQVVAGGGEEGSGLMLLCDLVSAEGELLGSQGWTVGSGWRSDDDGATLVHPTRKNVVASSLYGQFQYRVNKEIKVPMGQYGLPLIAATWNGLGFHWMLEGHETLKETEGVREKKQGLMPTVFIGVSEEIRNGTMQITSAGGSAVVSAPGTGGAGSGEISEALEKQLTSLAQANAYRDFVKAAVKISEVAGNDSLMSSVMDDGPDGYFAQHKK